MIWQDFWLKIVTSGSCLVICSPVQTEVSCITSSDAAKILQYEDRQGMCANFVFV